MSDQEEDFGRLLDDSLRTRRLVTGQQVRGRIVAILSDVAFVDVGGKGEASLALEELRDADGSVPFKVGDPIEAFVTSTAGGLTLSRRLARGAASKQQLEQAFRMGVPVEGKVEKANKGGFDVRVAGMRAFCPASQIDTARHTSPAEHEGRVYAFRILEFREGGRNLVVSRRVLLEEEQQRQAEALRASIVPGAVLSGRVASVQDYGVFVDLGAGVQGLIHVSELAWSRASVPAQEVRPGEEITVKVLRVDDDRAKVALSLKALQIDPWSRAAATYAVGQVHAGRVTRLAEFGAFVELEPGIEALAHASALPQTGRRDDWRATFRPGTVGRFEIQSLDLDRKRIGVAPAPEGAAREASEDAGTDAPVTAEVHGFGSMADQLRRALRPREPKS
jgi:small subunit ribosomal protein S1